MNANRVFDARGMGAETFSRKVCAVDPGATETTPPTHWLTSMANGDAAELAVLQAMTGGDLPDLPENVAWGVDGVISAVDAIDATDGAEMQVYSCAGDVEPTDHVAAILARRTLQYVPDPPV